MLKYWLWLSELSGVSKRRKVELLRFYGTAQRLYYADEELLSSGPDMSQEERKAVCDKTTHKAEEIINQCFELGIRILTWQDAQYPARLRSICDAPIVLYYKGRLPEFDTAPCLALIGARKATAFGMLTAKRFGYQLGRSNAIVISGLADGIDGMSMVGALSGGAPVVGVLGCGADVVYPRRNRALYEDTIAQGCILTEYPPHTPPIGYHFPVRNRIISGLSDGVVVIEAGAKSGSLITAQQALEQGRDVFAVPGPAGSEACAGSNRLLRDGAILVENGADVLEEYAGRFSRVSVFPTQGIHFGLTADELRQNLPDSDQNGELMVASKVQKPKKAVDNEKKPNYIELKALLQTLPPTQSAIVEALRDGPQLVDDVIAQTQLPTQEVMSALTMLEIRHLICRASANRYALSEQFIL